MPYGYYQLVRFLGMLGFVLLAYINYQKNKYFAVIFYLALGLLFQPFFKVTLGRTIWNIVDMVVSLGLILTLFRYEKKIK